LTVGGQPWKFAGYNLPCANPFQLTDSELGYYLDDIQQNSAANAIRVWFFQSQGGPGNWTNFDRVIAALKARGMRAVVTLTNETSTCDEPSATPPYKTAGWYQTGYKSPEGGYALSYRSYAAAVAAHYANEPTVAFWQLVNEASAPNSTGSCDEAVAAAALRTFSDDMVADIHAADPRHLINLGTQNPGQCGLAGTDYTFVQAGSVDLCEYHDYGDPAAAMSTGPDSLTQAVADCNSIGKPMFIGETGIPANVGPNGTPNSTCSPWPSCTPDPITITTLNQRASFFQAKIAAANQAGLAGYLIWVKSPFYTDSTDGYAIADGDPTEGVLSSALQPYPAHPPTSVPETTWAAGLMIAAVASMGVGAMAIKRRNLRKDRNIGP
jgi:hypothetical protein